jgi:hypothetical protein
MASFAERARGMGLKIDKIDKGMLSYEDQYGEVVYRQVQTMFSPPDREADIHETDGNPLPYFAVYTKEQGREHFSYCGIVSNVYKFIGHDEINEKIRQSISLSQTPSIREFFMSNRLVYMRTEFEISHAIKHPIVGDIIPIVVTSNSYNGTSTAKLAFGLGIVKNNLRISFAYRLGEISQVHTAGSSTLLISDISEYIGSFSQNILETISVNFQKELTEDDIMMTLEAIERIGKKKKESISTLLAEYQKENKEDKPSALSLFLAITHYSSFEKNLNIKRIMENAAETVLVIPPKMLDLLTKIQQQH